MECEITHKR
jgi:hypothetical protein